MAEDFNDIAAPTALSEPVTVSQVMSGMHIPPHQQILIYSGDQWEVFIQEWAYYALKNMYAHVQRFSGAGDRGIDIAGFTDTQNFKGLWDTFQCKHYDKPLAPTTAWPELGKILWHTFNKAYAAPRRYYFVAPRDVGTTLATYLADPAKLKQKLIENWDKHVRSKITETQEIPLEGALLAHVNAFDFSIFDHKTALQIVDEHRLHCPYHSLRFGGGLPSRPAAGTPPSTPTPEESRYVSQLLGAYSDHTKAPVPDPQALSAWPKLRDHFGRQREAFYHAESLRVFARDSVPPGTFEAFQKDIYDGVINIHDDDHPDGYRRVLRVTQAARELQITANALVTCSNPKDRDGICHQLANEDLFQWT